MNYKEVIKCWLEDEGIDEQTKAEIRGVRDEKELEDRFYKELEFGTAGLRGVIGAGSNRMNKYIVARATQGYADHLNKGGQSAKGVAIAYDSRFKSQEFARQTAMVLCANGIPAYLYDSIHSVPQLSFAIGQLGCAGGVVITASHNPKEYNGYKVYGANGAQIGPTEAQCITDAILAVESFGAIKAMEYEKCVEKGLLKLMGRDMDKLYFDYTKGLCVDNQVLAKAAGLKIVYTPLHGAGREPVTRLLGELGVTNLYLVEEQAWPDVEFSTVSAPNPEAPDAFDLAIKLANEKHADLILATDPDSDRLGVAVRDVEGAFKTLTGNQLGSLMLHYILDGKKRKGCLPGDGVAVKSIVSTNLADKIAQKYGVALEVVLTGFRFIGEKIDELALSGKGTFLFGFEESYGFLCGDRVRDKDAICAAMLVAETAAYYCQKNMSLLDGLEELYREFGYYREKVKNYVLYGKEGAAKIDGAMTGMREQAPRELGGVKVVAVRDFKAAQRRDMVTQEVVNLDLPSSNVLYYELEDGTWLCVRPSGTEPKLKVYVNGAAASAEKADEKLDKILAAADERLAKWLK